MGQDLRQNLLVIMSYIYLLIKNLLKIVPVMYYMKLCEDRDLANHRIANSDAELLETGSKNDTLSQDSKASLTLSILTTIVVQQQF